MNSTPSRRSDKAKRRNTLVLPDVAGMTARQAAHSYLDAGFMPHPWFVGDRGGDRTKVSAYKNFSFLPSQASRERPVVSETHDKIDAWRPTWRCGLVVSPASGLMAYDIDEPEEFEAWETDEFPETANASTGRAGGRHLLFDARNLSEDEWPTQGNVPGGQIKTAGFIGVAPSMHPNRKRRYTWGSYLEVAPADIPAQAIRKWQEEQLALKGGGGSGGDRVSRSSLWKTVTEASEGEQHSAILSWWMDCWNRGLSQDEILDLFWFRREQVIAYKDPWTRHGVLDSYGISEAKQRTIIQDGRKDELAGIRPVRVTRAVASPREEEEFWTERKDLSVIRQWARAQQVSPWALLGEIIAEVVCRTPPTLALPPVIGGYGTLNALMALTGPSGAGKGGASAVSESAVDLGKPEMLMEMERIPLGSGEGLPKNYGYFKSGEGIVRTAYTAITTCYEIDTYSAISERVGGTLTSELRKFFSGEDLGFGYGDPSKRVIIRKYTYRGVVIAGVQPERSGVILRDTGSGFAQRWMLLDSTDPYAPDSEPPRPDPLKWRLPPDIAALPVDSEHIEAVLELCPEAVAEIRQARKSTLRGGGDAISSHALYRQEKFAAGLAILGMRLGITSADWEMAGYAARLSDKIRDRCEEALAEQDARNASSRGHLDGIRQDAARNSADKQVRMKIERWVLRTLPDASAARGLSLGAIGKKRPADREIIRSVLQDLADKGAILAENVEYQGQPGTRYRRA